jgi:hypothetical protein
VRWERCCASSALDNVFLWWHCNKVDLSTLNSLATSLYKKDAPFLRKLKHAIASSMRPILVELLRVKNEVQNSILMLVAHQPPWLIGCLDTVNPMYRR